MCISVTLIMKTEWKLYSKLVFIHTSSKTYVVGAQKIHLNDNKTVLMGKTDDTQKNMCEGVSA